MMEEQAGFEARAVLVPRRARLTRIMLLLPAASLVAVAWVGASGPRSDEAIVEIPEATTVVAPLIAAEGSTPDAPAGPRPQRPGQVFGLAVQRLDDIELEELGRGSVVAVAGWYVATATSGCPPIAAFYRDGSLPEVRTDLDLLAFCERSGMLHASRPEPEDGRARKAGLPAVAVTLVVGIVAPRELEMIGAPATEVVVIGRFVESGDGCRTPSGCPSELMVDHVAWTNGA